MSPQADVHQWLSDRPGWHTLDDVCSGMGIYEDNARELLGKLRRWREVESRKMPGNKKGKLEWRAI